MIEKIVYVVHCVDTEGPLHESLTATSQRLNEIFGVELDLTPELLVAIQEKKVNLNGLEDEVAKVLSPQLLQYLDSWDKIDEMLKYIMSSKFRNQFKDSYGNGWIYNWHCLDHVGFETNPRRRDMGHHSIFDHYVDMKRYTKSYSDSIQFHHHPVGFGRHAHKPATNYLSNNPLIYEILARKIIDRKWFPSVYRPGFHTTRPDSHWFLEQYIPFEYANQAKISDECSEELQHDLSGGRFGDWRRATKTWTPYHPDHDDYQVKGNCRRTIAKCLNIGTRVRLLGRDDVNDAFASAQKGKSVVLGVTNHDFRNIVDDINGVRSLVSEVSKNYPGVKFKYSEAREAMRLAMNLEFRSPLEFEIKLLGNQLLVKSNHDIFGPQPFLALKTNDGRYYHDNFDFQVPFREWTYTFDDMTIPLCALESFGIAGNDRYGNVAVNNFCIKNSTETTRLL